MRYLISIAILVGFFSGCATLHRAEMAEQAKIKLIGMSKKALLTCAGVPVRSEKVEDLEFLTYVGGGDSVGYVGGGSSVLSLTDLYIIFSVIPVKTGIQWLWFWIPASAGMTS